MLLARGLLRGVQRSTGAADDAHALDMRNCMPRYLRWCSRSLPLLLALTLLLGLSPLAWSGGPVGSDSRLVSADSENGNQGNGNGNGNSGHGNGNDDNKSHGNDKEKDKEKDKGKNGKNENGQQPGPVTAAGDYTIDVTCVYQDVDDHTTCTFSGTALEGAKKVNHLVVPVDALCADVLGSDGKFVDPDPNTHATGYRTPGSTATIQLVLAGQATTGGKATYWFKSGGNTFPVTGPGLVCSDAEPAAAPVATEAPATETPLVTPTPDVTDSSGAVLVQVYRCPITDAAAVGEDYDWYGACTPGGAEITFRLTGDGTEGGPTQATAEDGQTQFGDLAPGLYDLALVDGAWCHAEADEVDAEGNVIVSAGEQTTVWIFTCTGG
jgi:hypothetical protein